jgi:(1->4)-alpha-D-glucan 1-alpha-D-glucosylmutase
VLLPILGGQYGEVLERGELTLVWEKAFFRIAYYEHRLPVGPKTLVPILESMPEIWRRALRAFGELAKSARVSVNGEPAPSASLEYLFYQTLLGVWPLGWDGRTKRELLAQRMLDFVRKASKEAKQQTSWTSPNAAYDDAVESFVRAMMRSDPFLDEMRKLSELIAPYGAANGLALAALKLCSPGVPDTYNGAEVWNQALVDPDNRRSVDFDRMRSALALLVEQRARDARALVRTLRDNYVDGRIKLYVTHVALSARRAAPDLFRLGDYEALPGGAHVVAFTRASGAQRIICAAARLSYQRTAGQERFAVGAVWGDERLRVAAAGRYLELLTNRELEVGLDTKLLDIFEELPVALLIRQTARQRH